MVAWPLGLNNSFVVHSGHFRVPDQMFCVFHYLAQGSWRAPAR